MIDITNEIRGTQLTYTGFEMTRPILNFATQATSIDDIGQPTLAATSRSSIQQVLVTLPSEYQTDYEVFPDIYAFITLDHFNNLINEIAGHNDADNYTIIDDANQISGQNRLYELGYYHHISFTTDQTPERAVLDRPQNIDVARIDEAIERAIANTTEPPRMAFGPPSTIPVYISINSAEIRLPTYSINRRSYLISFTYVQISLPNQTIPWRAIILCVVMKNNAVPLLIGANDQAAYAITPVPSQHMLFIGDLTRRPTHAVELLNHNEWHKAILLMKEAHLVEKHLEQTKRKIDDSDNESNTSTSTKSNTSINAKTKRMPDKSTKTKKSKPNFGSSSKRQQSQSTTNETKQTNTYTRKKPKMNKPISDDELDMRTYEKIKEPVISDAHEKIISDGLYAGNISIATACRHLEYLLNPEQIDTKISTRREAIVDRATSETDRNTSFESDSEHDDDNSYHSDSECYNDHLYRINELHTRAGQINTNNNDFTDNTTHHDHGHVYLYEDEYTLPLDPITNRPESIYTEQEITHKVKEHISEEYIDPSLSDEEIQLRIQKHILEAAEAKPNDNPIIGAEAVLWMNEYMHLPGRLHALQQEENANIERDPDRRKELEEDLKALKDEDELLGGDKLNHLRPDEFSEELWPYVHIRQKPSVKSRFESFISKEVLNILITDITTKLDICDKDKEIEKYLRAQALANLDCYGYPDPDNPPTIPGYMMPLKLEDNIPIFSGPQKLTLLETAFLKARINEFLRTGKVRASDSSMYNSPVMLVPYPERIKAFMVEHKEKAMENMFKEENFQVVGTFFRFTTNLRKVNQKTKPFHYPVPDATDVYHYTRGSRYYTSVDFRDAFFTVALAEEDRDKTAFTTPYGRYEWCVLPQGALNSSKLYSKVTLEALQHIPKSELINYIDDSLVHSRRFLRHLDILQKMYDAMRVKTMVCKIDKSHLGYDHMKALGHVISNEGRNPDPKLVNKLLQIAQPTDIQGVRSFLGILNFNREYITNLSDIIAPLQDLTCKSDKSIPSRWTELHTQAFMAAKHALTNAPCLLTIDPTKPFIIHTDACKIGRGLGAVLLQKNNKGD